MNDEITRQLKLHIYKRLLRRFGEEAFTRRIRSGWMIRAVNRRAHFGRP